MGQDIKKAFLLMSLSVFAIIFFYHLIYGNLLFRRVLKIDIHQSIGQLRELTHKLKELSAESNKHGLLPEAYDTAKVVPAKKMQSHLVNGAKEKGHEKDVNHEKTASLARCLEELRLANKTLLAKEKKLPATCRNILGTKAPKGRPCLGSDKRLVGPLYVNKEPTSFENLMNNELSFVKPGGRWSPENCSTTIKLAIVIPYRDREKHLGILLRQLLPMLKRQLIEFQMFVVEQGDNYEFNRGKLMNVGYAVAMLYNEFNCFVFHDVDLIPEDDRIDYGCGSSPQHLSVAIDKFNYKLLYNTLFGGVEMFSQKDFNAINGFSNSFWGWGAEDDNLYKRLVHHRMTLWRQSPLIAKYTMLKHIDNERNGNPIRNEQLQQSEQYFSTDGLSSLQYRILEEKELPLFTLIKVDLQKTNDRLFGALEKFIR